MENKMEELFNVNIVDFVEVGKEFYKQKYKIIKEKLDKVDNDQLLKLLEDLTIMRIILSCHNEIEEIKIDKQKLNIVIKIEEIYNFLNENMNKNNEGDVE